MTDLSEYVLLPGHLEAHRAMKRIHGFQEVTYDKKNDNNGQRRRSSLSQMTTLKDIVSDKSSSSEDESSGSVSPLEMHHKCYKCTRRFEVLDEKTATTTQRKRRSSSASMIYSDLLNKSNMGESVKVPFTLTISVSSSNFQGKKISIPFSARFMSDPNSDQIHNSTTSSPYFAEINLNDYFISQDPMKAPPGNKRKFPGYEIPNKGKLQLVISNNEKYACSLIIISYRLQGLEKNHKKIIKAKNSRIITYESDLASEPKPENVQIKKLLNEFEFKALNYRNKKFYMFDSLKLMFTPGSQTNDHNLPYSSNTTNTKGFQFNPKLPIYPSECKSSTEVITSDNFPVDLAYFVYRCSYCDYFGDTYENTWCEYPEVIVDDEHDDNTKDSANESYFQNVDNLINKHSNVVNAPKLKKNSSSKAKLTPTKTGSRPRRKSPVPAKEEEESKFLYPSFQFS